MAFLSKVKQGLSNVGTAVGTKVKTTIEEQQKKRKYEQAANAQIKKKAQAAYYQEKQKVAIKDARERARRKPQNVGSSILGIAGTVQSPSYLGSGVNWAVGQTPSVTRIQKVPKRKIKKKKTPSREWWDY